MSPYQSSTPGDSCAHNGGVTTPTRRTRRPVEPADGQITMTLGLLAERPGSQLDLIAEVGVEVIGPSTIAEPVITTLF